MNLDAVVEVALGRLDPAVAARLAMDPLRTLRQDLGIQVRAVERLADARREGGACDGVSFLKDGVILYAATAGSRRENFTLAHELGHWLVDRTDFIYDWLLEQPDPQKMMETVCDRIAQRLLLPDPIVVSVIGQGPVRAQHVLQLYQVSRASRPACAIASASRLRGLGAVVIIDPGAKQVTYASVHPDPDEGWPTVFPWPGQQLPAGHPVAALSPGRSLTRKSFWATPWGARQDYYLDAITEGERIIAVFSGLDIWGAERLHIDAPREYDRRPVKEIRCCGEVRAVRAYPCQTCGQPHCPKCGRCLCDRRAGIEENCKGCNLRYLPHLLVSGLCEACR